MTTEEIFANLQNLIAEQFALDPDDVTMNTSFMDDIGADSVDLVEFVMTLEEEFDLDEIPDEEYATLKTVGDCVRFLSARINQ